MDFSSMPLFNIMKSKLHYLSERQGVLAQNIANADTPQYRAMDIAAPDFKKMVGANGAGGQLQMTTTSPQHLKGQAGGVGMFKLEKRKLTDELNPSGNNISVEEEMSKASDNQVEYQKALSLYAKTIAMFKTAIGHPNNGA